MKQELKGNAKINITWNSDKDLGYTCYTTVRTMKEAMVYAIEKRGFKYKNENGLFNEYISELNRDINKTNKEPAPTITSIFCLSFILKFNTFYTIGCCNTTTIGVTYANE